MATITPVVGSIGQKTDRNNLLTYSLTGTMSTITEKVNGVTIGTKTATSGQSLTAGLTQAQWDAVAYGKYNFRNLIAAFDSGLWYTSVASVTVNSPSKITFTSSANGYHGYELPIKPNTTYTLSALGTRGYIIAGEKASIGGATTQSNSLNLSSASNLTFTTRADTNAIFVYATNETLTGTFTFENVMLNEGTAAKPYSNPKYDYNTLTVEMGAETFTYTFDKRLATDADLLSAVKASKDANEVYFLAVKSKLVAKVGANPTDSFETIIDGFVLGKAFIEINVTSNGAGRIVATGLTFRPKVIIAYNATTRNYVLFETYSSELNYVRNVSATTSNISTPLAKTDAIITDTSFDVSVNTTGAAFKCFVFG